MKTLHVVIGLAAVGGAAYWYSKRAKVAKAAASTATPAVTVTK